jgi:hypothetical protein
VSMARHGHCDGLRCTRAHEVSDPAPAKPVLQEGGVPGFPAGGGPRLPEVVTTRAEKPALAGEVWEEKRHDPSQPSAEKLDAFELLGNPTPSRPGPCPPHGAARFSSSPGRGDDGSLEVHMPLLASATTSLCIRHANVYATVTATLKIVR